MFPVGQQGLNVLTLWSLVGGRVLFYIVHAVAHVVFLTNPDWSFHWDFCGIMEGHEMRNAMGLKVRNPLLAADIECDHRMAEP